MTRMTRRIRKPSSRRSSRITWQPDNRPRGQPRAKRAPTRVSALPGWWQGHDELFLVEGGAVAAPVCLPDTCRPEPGPEVERSCFVVAAAAQIYTLPRPELRADL